MKQPGGVETARIASARRWAGRTFGLAALILSTACSTDARAGETCAVDEARAEEDLLQVSEVVINRNFAENRVEPFEPNIAEDITAFGPGARSLQVGKGPMMEALRRGAETKTTHKWEEWDWNIQVYDDIGIVTFLYEHDATREGTRARRVQRATYVFRCLDDRWQLVHDHTSLRPGEPSAEEESEEG